jgi:hypothetical protein
VVLVKSDPYPKQAVSRDNIMKEISRLGLWCFSLVHLVLAYYGSKMVARSGSPRFIKAAQIFGRRD